MNELEKIVMYNESLDIIFILFKVSEKILAVEVSSHILHEQIMSKCYETLQDLIDSSIYLSYL